MADLDAFLVIFCALIYFTNISVDRREAMHCVACYLSDKEDITIDSIY